MRLESLPGGRWALYSPYSQALVEACHQIPGLVWDKVLRAWVGYIDAWAECDNLAVKELVDQARVQAIVLYNKGSFDTRLRRYQLDGSLFLLGQSHEGALLADGMGFGKAQPLNEPVLTPKGWVSIGSLKVGDLVIGSKGTPVTVEGIFPQGPQPMFEVTFTDGAKTRCTAEHFWEVRTPKMRALNSGKRVWALSQIMQNGLSRVGKSARTNHHQHFIPLVQPVVFAPVTLPAGLDPYVLGAVLANGSLTAHGIIYSGGADQRAEICARLPNGVEMRPAGKDFAIRPIEHGGYNAVFEGLKNQGLVPSFSHTKFIPALYKLASAEARLSLLQGLLDNDGTVSKNGFTVEYNTVSPQLALDVQELVQSLGGTARTANRQPKYRYKGELRTGLTDHRVRVSLPGNMAPFRLPRKKMRYMAKTKYPVTRAFDKVQACGTHECVCIRVGSPDGLYVTRDFVVTHNTAQAISAVWSGADAPVIVCPSFVKGVWLREIAKWAPGGEATIKGVFQPEGLKPTAIPETYHTILVHYDILYAWVQAIKTWMTRDSVPNKWLVLDECHFISSEKARRSAACRELARVATHRVGLSGTPLTSRVRDLWNVVDTLSPGRFGNFFQYAKKYCDARQVVVGSGPMQKTVWDFDGRSNLDELSRRMKHFMLRRTHADVNLELPALTRQVVELRVTKKHRKAVTAGADKHALRASLDHAADAKLHDVVAMCKQHLEDGHSVVVGCYRRSVAEAVAKECNGVYIHGGLTHKQREEVIEGCRKCGEPCLLAATIDVAAVGIDLTFADVVVFCELTWEPHELAQFEARVFRFGQTKTTLVQYCIALSTSDELIRDGVIDKLEEVSTKVLGSDGTSLGADLRGGKTAEEELAEFWKGLVRVNHD